MDQQSQLAQVDQVATRLQSFPERAREIAFQFLVDSLSIGNSESESFRQFCEIGTALVGAAALVPDLAGEQFRPVESLDHRILEMRRKDGSEQLRLTLKPGETLEEFKAALVNAPIQAAGLTIEQIIRRVVSERIREHRGNLNDVATSLGVALKTVYNYIERMDLASLLTQARRT